MFELDTPGLDNVIEQTSGYSSTLTGGGVVGYVLLAIGLWQVFKKSGVTPWFALIPIINLWGVLITVKRPWWWLLLWLIPIVNIVIAIIVAVELARKFGKGGVFAFFLLFLFPVIGCLIIGFGQSRYNEYA